MLSSKQCQEKCSSPWGNGSLFPNFSFLPRLPGSSEFNLKLIYSNLLTSWLAYLSSPFLFRSPFFFSVFVNCILLYWVGQNFHSDEMKGHFGQPKKLSEILLGRKQDINRFRKKIGICLAYNAEKVWISHEIMYMREHETLRSCPGGVIISVHSTLAEV